MLAVYLYQIFFSFNIKPFEIVASYVIIRIAANVEFALKEREIPLGDHYFDDGPKILDGIDAEYITLKSKKSGRFVELGIKDFPYLCLWGVGSRMSIICIEPWCGTSDLADTDHVWETKLGIESVDVGGVFERTLTFRVG